MTEPVVTLENVKRYYETPGGTVRALDGVDLTVEKGEFFAIAGPSGSGKSTMLNLIGMLDRATEGAIVLEGQAVEKLSRTEQALVRRERIGFIFQAYNLIPVLTVLENVEYVMLMSGWDKKKRRARAMEVLAEVSLQGLENRKPRELSGGQQQRVAVARAIASRPSLVLADEPTANLDTKTSQALIEMMEELNEVEQVTFIFSTHDPRVMKRAGRLIHVVDGKIDREERR
ncbi:MAG: ABC transporter ATP-binding protein [Acidobacteriota bacterium]|nr:ABC transporter ATP-binding protein [Acidobacteriota bacterium]